MNKLEDELLSLICTVCNIPRPDDFDPAGSLVGPESALGIDSLDAVEIVVTVQKNYGVRIASEETGRKIMESLASLAEFLRSNGVK
ncbi:MAG: phosphopantetheine-binding protein [Desulfurivibrio sp.]